MRYMLIVKTDTRGRAREAIARVEKKAPGVTMVKVRERMREFEQATLDVGVDNESSSEFEDWLRKDSMGVHDAPFVDGTILYWQPEEVTA